jgi:hypothetical protein
MTQHSLQFASIYTPLVMLFHAKFKWPRNSITQHSLQFASIYTPLVMLFHAKFKIGRCRHTAWAKATSINYIDTLLENGSHYFQ